MMGDYVRDKDAVTASMMIAEMAAYYFSKGMTLADALEGLYEKYGWFMEKTREPGDARPRRAGEDEGADGLSPCQTAAARSAARPCSDCATIRTAASPSLSSASSARRTSAAPTCCTSNLEDGSCLYRPPLGHGAEDQGLHPHSGRAARPNARHVSQNILQYAEELQQMKEYLKIFLGLHQGGGPYLWGRLCHAAHSPARGGRAQPLGQRRGDHGLLCHGPMPAGHHYGQHRGVSSAASCHGKLGGIVAAVGVHAARRSS